MKKYFLFIITVFCMYDEIYSQSISKEIISVSAEIVAKGAPAICEAKCDNNNYFIRIQVYNNEDSTIILHVLRYPWTSNWKIDSDSIYLKPYPGSSRIIDELKLPPKKSLIFYGIVRAYKEDIKNRNFRVGFVNIYNEDLFFFGKDFDEKIKSKRAYWSNTISLTDNFYTYFID